MIDAHHTLLADGLAFYVYLGGRHEPLSRETKFWHDVWGLRIAQ
jgi:hypothetical protein